MASRELPFVGTPSVGVLDYLVVCAGWVPGRHPVHRRQELEAVGRLESLHEFGHARQTSLRTWMAVQERNGLVHRPGYQVDLLARFIPPPSL